MKIRPKARPLDWLRYRLFARSRPAARVKADAQKALAVFKAERLGDFLLAQPAIQRLVELHGAPNTTLIVSRACRKLADRFFPEVGKIEVALDFSWGGWNWIEARRQADALGRNCFETAVCLTHHRKPALWSAWTAIRAKRKIGIVQHPWTHPGVVSEEHRHFDQSQSYPRHVSPTGDVCLELEAHALVLNACGAGPVAACDLRPRLKRGDPRLTAGRPALGIAPRGSARLKSPPDELVGAVCRQLAASAEFDVWLIGERAQCDALGRLRAHLAGIANIGEVRVCSQWDLGQLETGLARCTALVSADTFTAHLATAMDLPLAVLATGAQPGVFGPWRNSGRQRWFTHEMDCSGCGWRCTRPRALCVERIDAGMVAAFLKGALTGG